MFYLLNILSGMLEFGYVMYAARCGWDPVVCLLFPLAYQVGRLFPRLFSLGRVYLVALFLFSVEICSCMTFIDFGQTNRILLICLNLAVLSALIHSVKETFRPVESKKNALLEWGSRLAGIIAAPVCAFFPVSAMCFPLAVLFPALRYHLRITNGKFKPGEVPLLSGLEIVAYAIGLIAGIVMVFLGVI